MQISLWFDSEQFVYHVTCLGFVICIPDRLCTCIVYKFSCASCNACYVGETSRHFSTRVHEHLSSDRSSHVYKHLQASESCRTSCNLDCFKILDSAPTKYQVKLKESMYIKWEKPDLNQQVKHINLTLSLQLHAHLLFPLTSKFIQRIVFQRNVTFDL